MASFFYLTLDTTPPNIKIIAPNTASSTDFTEIMIESNEPILDGEHEIYFIDSLGNRRDYIFSKINDCMLLGIIRFNDVSNGIGTLYARLKDRVYNQSDIASHNIQVIYNENIIVNLEDRELYKTLLNDDYASRVILNEEIDAAIDVEDKAPINIDNSDYSEYKVEVTRIEQL